MNSLPGMRGMACQFWSGNVGVGGRGQVKGDLGLQRVRVLELVNENVGVSLLEVATGWRIVAQQVTRPHQEVVKGGHPFGLALSHIVEGEALPEVVQDPQGWSEPDRDFERLADLLAKLLADLRNGSRPVFGGRPPGAGVINPRSLFQGPGGGRGTVRHFQHGSNGLSGDRHLFKQAIRPVQALCAQRFQFAQGRLCNSAQVDIRGHCRRWPTGRNSRQGPGRFHSRKQLRH